MSNAGQGGSVGTAFKQVGPPEVNPFLIGGYGTVLNQIFSRNFPNYSAQVTLTVPIRNRASQADLVTNELSYRQAEIQDRQLHNTIKLNVMNSVTALRNARAAWETSVVARKLYDQTLAGTRRKYELGTATILDVVIAQRDSTARQLSEADALNQYQRARTNLDQTLGKTLDDYNVSLEEAQRGVVGREPDLIPVAGGNR
jgi:outer membrane protein TolC